MGKLEAIEQEVQPSPQPNSANSVNGLRNLITRFGTGSLMRMLLPGNWIAWLSKRCQHMLPASQNRCKALRLTLVLFRLRAG